MTALRADGARSNRRGRRRLLPRRVRGGLVRLALPALQVFLWPLPWRLVLGAGWLLGWVGYAVQPHRRRRARENLARAFGAEMEGRRMRMVTRRVFTSLGMNLAEICWVAARPARADRLVEFRGWEHMEAALAGGRGVVTITGHLGSWELLAAAAARRGLEVSVIARETQDGRVNRFLLSLRTRLGLRTVLRGSVGAARAILRALRSGGALASLIDQDTRVEGIFVDFFGRPAYTPSGPISLALRAGAPVLLAAIRRLPDGRHRVRFDPPFQLDRSADRDEEVRRATEACTRWIEARIREHPDQWVWIHRRWRRSEREGDPAAQGRAGSAV